MLKGIGKALQIIKKADVVIRWYRVILSTVEHFEGKVKEEFGDSSSIDFNK